MLLNSLQDGNFPFKLTKKKTNETCSLSRKLDLIRQNDITKSGLSIH